MYFKKLNIAGVDYEMETTIVGHGEPGSSTVGNVGQFYLDLDTNLVFKCIGATAGEDDNGNPITYYEWDNIVDADALNRLSTSLGADLEFDESSETLYLKNKFGSLIGNGAHIRVGLSGLEILTEDGFDDEGDPVQYIALYDSDHNLISRTEIALAGGGGGGGGGGGDIMRLINTTTANGVLTNSLNSVLGDPDGVTLSYRFQIIDANGEPVSDIGTVRYYNDGVLIGYGTIDQGEVHVTFKSGEGEKLHAGNNVIRVAVEDSNGNKRSISYYITVINLTITSDFDVSAAFKQENTSSGEIIFPYVPYGGDIEKTVHFELDGRERDTVVTRRSGAEQTYTFGGLSHGHHTLRCWMTAELMGNPITSNVLFFDFLYVRTGNSNAVMAVNADYTSAVQGDVLTFPYVAYGGSYMMYTIDVERANAQTGNNEWRRYFTSPVYTVDETQHIISIRDYPVGNIKISFFVSKSADQFQLIYPNREFVILVSGSDVNLSISRDGIDLMLDAIGRTNSESVDSVSVWRDSAYNLSSSLVGFDYKTNGWVLDSDGAEALKVSGGANVTIPYQPFNPSPIATGGSGITIELDFKTDEVSDSDADLISCMSLDGEDHDYIGFRVRSEEVIFKTSAHTLSTPFEPGKRTRIAFVVEAPSNQDKLIHMYVNGVDGSSQGVCVYNSEAESINQTEGISIRSTGAAIWIYGIRVYRTAKDQINVMTNYLASIPSVVEQTVAYNRNQIYDGNTGEITQNTLHDSNPDLTIVMISGPTLPTAKSVSGGGVEKHDTTVSGQIIDPDPNLCVTFENQKFAVQGTSSAGYFRKNYKLTIKKCYLASDHTQEFPGYKIRSDSMYAQKLCFKKDVASSEQSNNVLLARLYNDLCPYKSPAQEEDENVRQGIDGKPCVIFYTCTDPNSDNYTDGQPIFYGKYNLNIDKGSENVFGFDQPLRDENGNLVMNTSIDPPEPYKKWPNAQSWEFRNNTSKRCLFKISDFVNKVDGDFEWKNDFEARYPENSEDTARFAALCSWIQSTDTNPDDQSTMGDALPTGNYYVVPTEQKGLMRGAVEYVMYEMANGQVAIRTVMKDGIERKVVSRTRYVTETITVDGHDYTVLPVDAQGNELYYYTHDTAAYREEKFYQELSDHFDLNDIAFYYIFTELFLMVDNRAKNMFLTTYDGTKWMFLPYDFDTALGINNEGELAFSYGLEATDTVGGAYVFNDKMQSVLWNNYMNTFGAEIEAMFRSLDETDKISPDAFLRYFSAHQDSWPVSLWNHDENWTYRPSLVGGGEYLEMWQGKKETQREWWYRRRFVYLASKYLSKSANADSITIRGYTPDSVSSASSLAVVPASGDLTLTPYQDYYANVKWGSWESERVRSYEDTAVVMEAPEGLGQLNDTEIYIRSASALKKIGSLAGLYPGYIDVSNAKHLEELVIGNASSAYLNSNCDTVNVGQNTALKKVDVRGLSHLEESLDLSGCPNIEEVYAERTALKVVLVPNGGCLRVLHLPATINTLSVRNQTSLEDFSCAGYTNVTRLSIENCPLLEADLDDILTACTGLRNLRITNVNWEEETSARLVNLATLGGIDEYGADTPHAVITGSVHIDSCSSDDLSIIKSAFPNLNVTFTSASATLTFVNADWVEGDEPLWTLTVPYGGTGRYPSYEGANADIEGEPTLASTAQYDYTFSGWAGNISNVTESRIIRATYDATVRTYGVTWKNGSTTLGYGADGTAVSNAQNVPYGTVLRYGGTFPEPPENKAFAGWTFKNTDDNNTETTTATEALTMTVMGTTVVEATFATYAVTATGKSFSSCTWAEIMSLCEMARAGTLPGGAESLSAYGWSVGDEKQVTLKSNETVTMKIWDFDSCLDENDQPLPVVIGAKHCLLESQNMLDTDGDFGQHQFDYTVSDNVGGTSVRNYREPEDLKKYYWQGTPVPGNVQFTYEISSAGKVTILINDDTELTSIDVYDGDEHYIYYVNGYRKETNTAERQDVNYFAQEDCVDENGDSSFERRMRCVINSGPVRFKYLLANGNYSPEIVIDGTDGDIKVFDEYYTINTSYNAYRHIRFEQGAKIEIPFANAGKIIVTARGSGNIGGFECTKLRWWINTEFLDQLPAIIQLHINPIKRETLYGASYWDKTTTYYDKVIIPTFNEFGYSISASGFYSAYSLESGPNFASLSNVLVREMATWVGGNQSQKREVWVSSVNTVLLGYYRAVRTNGNDYQILTGSQGGVLPGFCPGYIEEGGLE